MERRADWLGCGERCDLDIEVSAAVGVGEQLRPALGAISPRDPLCGLGVDDRDIRADPLCVRAADAHVFAVGEQLDPLLGLYIELGGCETNSDRGEAPSVSTARLTS